MTVSIRGLEFYAYHGVPDEEQAVGHRYTADVRYILNDEVGETDDIDLTVDYAAVTDFLIATAQAVRYRTLERLVSVCGERLMSTFPPIEVLTLKISKRLPPMPAVAESVGVERTFSRS